MQTVEETLVSALIEVLGSLVIMVLIFGGGTIIIMMARSLWIWFSEKYLGIYHDGFEKHEKSSMFDYYMHGKGRPRPTDNEDEDQEVKNG